MSILVGDLETNGFKPDRIWVVGVLDVETDEYTSYVGDDVAVGLMRLAEADLVIGHNFKEYDAKVISKLTESVIEIPNEKIIDTLELGRMLFPQMPNHKLATWGEMLGLAKIEYEGGFDEFNEDMLPYCERDCRVNKLLYEFLLTQLEEAA